VHSAAQAFADIMHACSMVIMPSTSIAAGRSVIRIMVLLMSAQFMHIAAHFSIAATPIELVAHIVHACSQAEQASTKFCMAVMSMRSIIGVSIFIALMSM
jgi:hypothetical protein